MPINNIATDIQSNFNLPYKIINKSICSYNNDGAIGYMDKIENANIKKYEFDNNIVAVERHFTGNSRINEILKKYIVERKNKFALSNSDEKCYNSLSNTTVEDFSERRGE